MGDNNETGPVPKRNTSLIPGPRGGPMYTPEEQQYVDQVERELARSMNRRSRAFEPLKENPLVPIGAAATAAVLVGGLLQFVGGRSGRSQVFMRARVLVQGGTVLAAFGGVAYMKYKEDKAKEQSAM